jgi:hypothetical protein
VSHFIKPGTFIDNYMSWMEEHETPVIYDMMCGYWALSVALGRDVIVDRPRAPIHLNMYMILVSESGIMRKSTSIKAATNIVRDYLLRTNSQMQIVESQITKGALLDDLNRSSLHRGDAQIILVASELAAMLGRGSQISGVPALLTDLYDCPDERTGGGSIHSGTIQLNNVYCSFLAGSTPSWLDKAVRPEIIAGGFTSRCFFVNGRNRKRLVAWPKGEVDVDAARREHLVEQLRSIAVESRAYARIGITDGAKETFTRWYGTRQIHKDVYRESFESREDSHVLKLAGLMASNERAWCICDDHVRRAINLVAELKRYGTDLFTGVDIARHDVKTLRKMRNEILAAGSDGIVRSVLYRNLFLTGRARQQFGTLLNTMHELDLIRRLEVNTAGRPRELIIATEYLKNELLLEDVARKLGME